MRSPLLWILWSVLAVVPATPEIEERYNFFNIDFLQRVNENVEGNVILSPASAKVALTSLVEATGGRTRQELLAALRLPPDDYTIRKVAKLALTPLKSSQNGTEIGVATRYWINPFLAVSSNFVTALQRYYDAEIAQINFGDANATAQLINSWVRDATRNNIESIVQPNTLAPDTQLLLTSALYFKGRWLKSFEKDATNVRCFHVPVRGCHDVPMMESANKYRYAYVASLDAEVVQIPYSDGRTSMLVFLPNHQDSDPNLQILSKDLSYVPMKTLLANLYETDMVLVLPRFSIENKLNLQLPLLHMGVQDIFSTGANFTGIGQNDYLRVGNILQNVKISIDEEGTIAAAVTDLTVIPLMGVEQTFIANRPFIFAIVDTVSSEILFAGRIMDPIEMNFRKT